MSDDSPQGALSEAFLAELEKMGFFQQIQGLETNLSKLAEDLRALGKTATQRLEETDSLAAHVLAVEAILTVLIKSVPVDAEAVKAVIKEKTAEISGNPEGSPTVHAVAAEFLAKAGGGGE